MPHDQAYAEACAAIGDVILRERQLGLIVPGYTSQPFCATPPFEYYLQTDEEPFLVVSIELKALKECQRKMNLDKWTLSFTKKVPLAKIHAHCKDDFTLIRNFMGNFIEEFIIDFQQEDDIKAAENLSAGQIILPGDIQDDAAR